MSVPENLTRTSSGGTIALTIEEGKTMLDSTKESILKYRRENERKYFFGLIRKTRPKMIEYLDSVENKQAYIRHLIAVDMKSKGLETDGIDGEMEETP